MCVCVCVCVCMYFVDCAWERNEEEFDFLNPAKKSELISKCKHENKSRYFTYAQTNMIC